MFAILAIIVNIILVISMNERSEITLSAVALQVGVIGIVLAYQMWFNHTDIKNKLSKIEGRLKK
jgi:hypothetical protein